MGNNLRALNEKLTQREHDTRFYVALILGGVGCILLLILSVVLFMIRKCRIRRQQAIWEQEGYTHTPVTPRTTANSKLARIIPGLQLVITSATPLGRGASAVVYKGREKKSG